MYEAYRERVKDTTIDSGTLLSTDYFNLFNEVIMLLGMAGDMPDLLDEVDAWQFKTYAEHFEASGLAFAPLAIEAYDHVPPRTKAQFEDVIAEMRATVDTARTELDGLRAAGDTELLALRATDYSVLLQQLVDRGSAVVHGRDASLDQSAVDELF